MNFGETLAYWYLRLNGFFPLSNFVLHRTQKENRTENSTGISNSADTDILAVRFPYVYEEIGGRDDDWDWDLFIKVSNEAGIEIKNGLVPQLAFIVQVKTTKNDSDDYQKSIKSSFKEERLLYAINRFGIFPERMNREIAKNLNNRSALFYRGTTFVKILIGRITPDIEGCPLIKLPLTQVENFIIERFKNYKEKHSDRLFFPGDLVQYLVWRAENNS